MTIEMIALFLLLTLMAVLFLTERIPVDVTALVGLGILVVSGLVTPDEAFSGFSSPALILMLATFFVSGALRRTGVTENLADSVVKAIGANEGLNVAAVMLIAATISSFMNNVAATAVLLPAVAGISERTKIPPGRLFIPLTFGVLLGGTSTLIGNTGNMLTAEIMRASHLPPFRFLDFTTFGVVLVLLGVLFVAFVGRHLLPGHETSTDRPTKPDLASLYRLHERMFSLRIPRASKLGGQSLSNLHFAEVLGTEVMAVRRSGKTLLAPTSQELLLADDLLIVRGRLEELKSLLRLHGSRVERFDRSSLKTLAMPLEGASIRLTRKALSGARTLKELKFREHYSLIVVGIERGSDVLRHDLANERLHESDLIQVLGDKSSIEALAKEAEFITIERESQSVEDLLDGNVFTIELAKESALNGCKVRDSRLGELVHLTVVGIVRDGLPQFAVSGDELIHGGDTLIVAGQSEHAERLIMLSDLVIESETVASEFESPEIGVMEVVLAPRSKLIGKTIEEVHFRERYGFQVLAIWHDGEPKRARFAHTPLRFGDALLIQGPRAKMGLFAEDNDFVVLSGSVRPERKIKKAPAALLGLAVMVLLSVTGIEPPHVAALLAALVVVLAGAVTMEEIYREIEWRLVILVASLLPIGIAVQKLGVSSLLSGGLVSYGGNLGPIGLLILLVLVACAVSQLLDSTIVVVLLGPVAIGAAEKLGITPYPFLMAITLAASVAFITPFSHRAHLLIMGPGGYRAVDFMKIGVLLSILSLSAIVGMIAVYYNL